MSDTRFPRTEIRSEKQAIAYVQRAIKNSFLIKLNSYQGRELRGHNGKVYVCSQEKNGDIVVHTILKANKYVG